MYRFLFLFSTVMLLTPACKKKSERQARIDAYNSFNKAYHPMLLETKDAMAYSLSISKSSNMKKQGDAAINLIKKIKNIIKKVKLLPAKNKDIANIKKLAIIFHKKQVEAFEMAYKAYTTKDKKLALQYSKEFENIIKNQMLPAGLKVSKAQDAYIKTLKKN